MKRRFFLFAAPAIVAAPSLMKISALAMPAPVTYAQYSGYDSVALSHDDILFSTIRARMPRLIAEANKTNRLLHHILYGGEQNRLTS